MIPALNVGWVMKWLSGHRHPQRGGFVSFTAIGGEQYALSRSHRLMSQEPIRMKAGIVRIVDASNFPGLR